MTDLQTLQNQVNFLKARIDDLTSTRNITVLGQDVASPQTNFTGTSTTNLSAVYTVSGGDANTDTIYRFTSWGDFQIPASSPQTFTWDFIFGAQAWCAMTLGAAYQGGSMASAAMEWTLVCHFAVAAAGSAGTVSSFAYGSIAQFGSNLGNANAPGPQSNSLALAAGTGDTTVDTTTAHSVAIRGKFGAAVTSPQRARYFGSILERIGP